MIIVTKYSKWVDGQGFVEVGVVLDREYSDEVLDLDDLTHDCDDGFQYEDGVDYAVEVFTYMTEEDEQNNKYRGHEAHWVFDGMHKYRITWHVQDGDPDVCSESSVFRSYEDAASYAESWSGGCAFTVEDLGKEYIRQGR